MFARTAIWLIPILGVLFLGACSGSSNPILLASSPRLTPIAAYPSDPEFRYVGYLELLVWDPEQVSKQALILTGQYHGYLLKSTTGYLNGRESLTLEIEVPSENFTALFQGLSRLGKPLQQFDSVNDSFVPSSPLEYGYSRIIVHLIKDKAAPPASKPIRWNPGITFWKAWRVSAGIFSFLADILIWLLVVGGPFIAIGFILWKLAARLQRPRAP